MKSAKRRNPFAQNALGFIVQDRIGSDRDLAKAATCYQNAAKQGYAEDQLNLGQA